MGGSVPVRRSLAEGALLEEARADWSAEAAAPSPIGCVWAGRVSGIAGFRCGALSSGRRWRHNGERGARGAESARIGAGPPCQAGGAGGARPGEPRGADRGSDRGSPRRTGRAAGPGGRPGPALTALRRSGAAARAVRARRRVRAVRRARGGGDRFAAAAGTGRDGTGGDGTGGRVAAPRAAPGCDRSRRRWRRAS